MLGAILALSTAAGSGEANARTPQRVHPQAQAATSIQGRALKLSSGNAGRAFQPGLNLYYGAKFVRGRPAWRGGEGYVSGNADLGGARVYAASTRYYRSVLQCVPFARDESGIELTGNAADWWDNAAGLYERGQRPEVGSILSFRATGRMRLGHVAVVTHVLGSRTVEIDHAHWGGAGASRSGVARNITVVDVSDANDWSAVRVSLGDAGDFGSIYPTYGFIYGRPDTGRFLAAKSEASGARHAASGTYDEVAEAPERAARPSR